MRNLFWRRASFVEQILCAWGLVSGGSKLQGDDVDEGRTPLAEWCEAGYSSSGNMTATCKEGAPDTNAALVLETISGSNPCRHQPRWS